MPPSSSPNSIANVRRRPSSVVVVVRTVQAEIYIAIFGCSSKMPLCGDYFLPRAKKYIIFEHFLRHRTIDPGRPPTSPSGDL